ncbi:MULTISPECIES: TonB family protein [unclassified Myxococcus]|uniref:TonB family protein n=1 Tax=unclassified Myxococcus TaxID=2648731 RepID=UPI00157A56EF|nr:MULTISPECIES: TonB family protein [unclassified Myxococcus]NTX35776.1 TonB family protein [Myxococcus sp. CA033]NTX52704.1 TonB family protein [Myxococcus sp. CA039A]
MIKGDSPNPETPAATGADPLIGRTLNGRFSILDPLGIGGMGKVYRALQAPLERVVALKVLNPSYSSTRDPGFQKRFLREASLTSKLRHPNTVTVIDYGQTDDGIFYIAMEYLDGRTLAQVLGQVGPLSWSRAIAITQQICRSLREAHSLGIIHRDLKPANIMLLNEQDQDLVKVLDFGLVKSVAEPQEGQIAPEITQNGTFLGSPQYMAPEQARNATDARSDVYSLGIVLFQMLMGRPPFIARDHIELIFAHYKEAPPTFQQLRPDIAVPPEIEAVVRRCLEKDPARRFQTMDELLEGLREASMSAGGNSGIFKRPGGATTTGPYPSPLFSSAGSSGTDSGDTLAVDISVEVPVAVQRARQRTLAIGGLGGLAVAGLVAVGAVFFMSNKDPVKPPETKPEAVAQAPVQAPPTAPAQEAPIPAGAHKVRFKLMSQPSGARVFYRGKERGTTPFTLELPAGQDGSITVELTFAMEGYQMETVVTGGSGDVVLSQKLQKRRGGAGRGGGVEVASASAATDEVEVAEPVATPGGMSAPVLLSPTQAIAAEPAAPQTAGGVGAAAATQAKGVSGGLAVPVLPTAALASARGDVLPYNEDMSRPEMVDQSKDLVYTREAMAAKAEGVMIVRCTITTKGRVEKCRVIKSVTYMEKPVLDSLQSRTYKPIMYQGHPVNVDYTFSMRLVAPRR